MKIMVCPPNGGTNFFDFVAGVFKGDTLASFQFITYLRSHTIDIMKENSWGRPEGSLFNSYYTKV